MQSEQLVWSKEAGWRAVQGRKLVAVPANPVDAQLVLFFGDMAALKTTQCYEKLHDRYPYAHIVGCSSDGEITGDVLYRGAITVLAISFTHTSLRLITADIEVPEQSFAVGHQIATGLADEQLKGVILLSDGTRTDGRALAKAFAAELPEKLPVIGASASAGVGISPTLVGGDGKPREGMIAAIGLYGPRLRVSYGNFTGCRAFGEEYTVTRAEENRLYELNQRKAVNVYHQYLKDHAEGDIRVRLRFPFRMRPREHIEHGVLRTVVEVNEEEGYIAFAGAIAEGQIMQLMIASPEEFITTAEREILDARFAERQELSGGGFGLLLSAVGRKAWREEKIDEEVEIARSVLPANIPVVGGYMNGQFSPNMRTEIPRLHNYTMTLALVEEY